MTDIERVQVYRALEAVAEATAALEDLDGIAVPTVDRDGKHRSARLAQITKELLRADHLLSRAKVAVMDTYFDVKDDSIGRSK